MTHDTECSTCTKQIYMHNIHIHIYIYTYIYTYTHTETYALTMHTHTYIYIYIYMYKYIHYAYIYIYIPTSIQTHNIKICETVCNLFQDFPHPDPAIMWQSVS